MQASLRSSDYQQQHHHHLQQQHQHESEQQYYGYTSNVTACQPPPIDCVASLLRQHQPLPQDYVDLSQESSDLATPATESVNVPVLPHQDLHSANQLELLDNETNLVPQQEQQPDQTFSTSNYDRYLAFNHGQHLTNDRDDDDDDEILRANDEEQHQNHEQYQLTGELDSSTTVMLDRGDPSRREQQHQQSDYSYHQIGDQSVYYELTAASFGQDELSSQKSNVAGINLQISNNNQQQNMIERQEVFHRHHYDATGATTTATEANSTGETAAAALLPQLLAQQQTPTVVQSQNQLTIVPDEYQHQHQHHLNIHHHHHHHHQAKTNYHQHQSMTATVADHGAPYPNCHEQAVASSLGAVQAADQNVQLSSHLYPFNYSGAKSFSTTGLHQDTHLCYQSLSRVGQFSNQSIDGHQASVVPLPGDPNTIQRQHSLGAYDSPAVNHNYHDHRLSHHHLNHHQYHQIDYHNLEDSTRGHEIDGVQSSGADEGQSGPQYVTGHRFQRHHHDASTVNDSTGSNSLRNSYSSALSSSSSSSASSKSSSSSSASIGSDLESVDSTVPRDEKKAREANIPLSYNEIVNLSIDQFNEHIARFHFTEAQLTLMRDIRRRGKNKVAAQTCRRRKMEQITELQHELNHLSNKRLSLSCERSRLTQEHFRLTKDYEKLYSIIQNHMN